MEISDNTKEKLQNWFNIMWNHARQMEKPSQKLLKSGTIVCAYRGENGNKCLIGALIPDEKYSPKLETESLLSKEFEDIIGSLSDKDIPFLSDCRGAHDDSSHLPNAKWKSDMLQQLTMIAEDHDLSIPQEKANS